MNADLAVSSAEVIAKSIVVFMCMMSADFTASPWAGLSLMSSERLKTSKKIEMGHRKSLEIEQIQ